MKTFYKKNKKFKQLRPKRIQNDPIPIKESDKEGCRFNLRQHVEQEKSDDDTAVAAAADDDDTWGKQSEDSDDYNDEDDDQGKYNCILKVKNLNADLALAFGNEESGLQLNHDYRDDLDECNYDNDGMVSFDDDSNDANYTEDIDIDTDAINKRIKEELRIHKLVQEIIVGSDLSSHLSSKFGGQKSAKSIKTLIGRVSHALSWICVEMKLEDNLDDMIRRILMDLSGAMVIISYAEYLEKVMCRRSSTVLSYAEDLWKFLKWYVMYEGQRVSSVSRTLSTADLSFVNDAISSIRSIYKKSKAQELASSCDIENLVNSSHWPKGGLNELQACIKSELVWISEIDENTTIDSIFYNEFTKVMSSALYLFSPQGRKMGIEDTRLCQKEELMREGVILSGKLKTKISFEYQPVTAGDIFLLILEKFVAHVRPKKFDNKTDFLFVDFYGNKLDLGRKVTSYFESKLQLHITTTTIRSLVETEIDALHESGKINQVQRTAISNVNGHSSAITKRYYVKKNRRQDAKDATYAFNMLDANYDPCSNTKKRKENDIENSNLVPADSLHTPEFVTTFKQTPQSFTATAERVKWGEAEINFATTPFSNQYVDKASALEPVIPKRVKWSEAEINFVGTWCEKALRDNPRNTTNLVARCLHYIRSDKTISAIFHPNHVLNSGRLKHGLDAYNERHNVND